MSFILDSRIEETSFLITHIDEFQIRLVNDKRYLWLLVIPIGADLTELDDLTAETQTALIRLASQLSSELKSEFKADKMNIATIGNIVPQFHLHIIARHKSDEAWPAPIWGRGEAMIYEMIEADLMIDKMQSLLKSLPLSKDE